MRILWARLVILIIALLLTALPVAASDDNDRIQQDESDSAAVRVIPNEGDIGDSHVILVTGLEDGETVTVRIVFDDTEAVVYSNEQTANNRGTVEIDIFTETGDAPGEYTVEVVNGSGDVIGTATLTVLAPLEEEILFTAEPAEADAGETFVFTLENVEPFVLLEVTITDENGDEVFNTQLRATVEGDATFEYDSSMMTNGELSVVVEEIILDEVTEVASTTITVLGQVFLATVMADSAEVTAGETVFVTVSGLTPDAEATLDLVFDELITNTITDTANVNGLVIFEVPLALDAAAGEYELQVSQGGALVGVGALTVLMADDATAQADDTETETTTDEESSLADTGVTVQVDPTEVAVGDTIFITVSGLEPESEVAIDILEGEAVVDTLTETANISGLIIASYTLPDDLPASDYSVAVRAGDALLSVSDFVVLTDVAVAPADEVAVDIEPAIARQGERVEIVVTNLMPETAYTVEITLDGDAVFTTERTTDANGALGVAVTSSSDDATGTYDVTVRTGDDTVAQGAFDIVSEDAEIETATLTITPETGTQGTEYVLQITGLDAGESVDVVVSQADEAVFEATRTADDNGDVIIVLDSSADDAIATYDVDVTVGDTTLTGSFAITEAEALPAELTIEPDSGPLLTQHEVTVTGLEAGETFALTIELDGEEVYNVERTADADGTFTTTLATAEGDPVGEYTVIIDRENADDLTAVLTVTDGDEAPTDDETASFQLTIEPAQIASEEAFEIVLTGLDPEQEAVIEILFDGDVIFETTRTADAGGNITIELVSEASDPEGEYTISATVGDETLTQTLTIGSAAVATGESDLTIEVAPASGPRGTEYIFEVSDLEPSEDVTVEVRFEGETVFETDRTANQDGAFSITLESGPEDAVGDYEFVVVREDGSETIAVFTVDVDDPEDDDSAASDVDVVVDPATIELGGEFVITITGLEANENVTIDIQFDGESIFATEESADADGTIELPLVSEGNEDPGEYDIIVLRGDTEVAAGSFVLGDEVADAETDDPEDEIVTGLVDLTDEDTDFALTGTLTSDEPEAVYTLVGEAGQLVTVTLDSQDFDTYLFILDENGDELISNDDSRGTLNSQIENYSLPYSGEYTVLVSSFQLVFGGEPGLGDFDLSIVVEDGDADETADADDQDIQVGGEPIVDSLDEDNQQIGYTFTGEQGTSVLITLDSFDFDTYLILVDNQGNELTFNDDSRQSLNSQIGPYTLPYSGEYTIVVTSYRNRTFGEPEEGEFTLRLETVAVIAAEYDETVEVVFDGSASTQNITFDAVAGDVISITADSNGSVDTVATLTTEFGALVASDDDGGSGLDPEIERLVIEVSGTYTLILSTFIPGERGAVDVTISLNDRRTLDNDEVRTVRLNNKQNADVLILEGNAGEIISLEIDLVSGSIADLQIVANQGGFQIMSYNTFGLPSTVTLGFEVPQDGTVSISFRDAGQVNAVLEVSITRE